MVEERSDFEICGGDHSDHHTVTRHPNERGLRNEDTSVLPTQDVAVWDFLEKNLRSTHAKSFQLFAISLKIREEKHLKQPYCFLPAHSLSGAQSITG